jgi:hypothetical protein
MLARQRSSPYLPGIRSRLWRFVEAKPSQTTGRSSATGEAPPDDVPGPAAAPVIALISRLPLDDEE